MSGDSHGGGHGDDKAGTVAKWIGIAAFGAFVFIVSVNALNNIAAGRAPFANLVGPGANTSDPFRGLSPPSRPPLGSSQYDAAYGQSLCSQQGTGRFQYWYSSGGRMIAHCG